MVKKVDRAKVKKAIDTLLDRRDLISARSVREEIGFGSFSTISKYLKEILSEEDFSTNYDNKRYISKTLNSISDQAQSLSLLINPDQKDTKKGNELYSLIYISSTGEEFKGRRSLKEIEEKSIQNNTKSDITGLLLYSEGKFLQVIEGVPYDLVNLYQKIVRDNRNKDNKLLWLIKLKVRIFPKWALLTSEMHRVRISGK